MSLGLDNARMRIQDLFEDLEAQFEAANQVKSKLSNLENVRAIQIKTNSQSPKELIAPILGLDFVAGLDPVAPIWQIFPTTEIKSIELGRDVDSDLPLVRNFETDLHNFLANLPKPCAIRWRSRGIHDYLQAGQLLELVASFMLVSAGGGGSNLMIPIDGFQQLSVEIVDNFSGNF